MWWAKWGPSLEFLQQQAEDGETPEALANMPDLDDCLEPFLEAFFTLSAGRPVGGMGVGPLVNSEIILVADLYGLDRWEALHLCRAMDDVYLADLADRQVKKNQRPPPHGHRPPRPRN